MIADEVEDKPIDFSFFYFIGRNKLGFTYEETGRLTLSLFNKMYKHYKDCFDLEMQMKAKNVTYSQLYVMSQKEQEWF